MVRNRRKDEKKQEQYFSNLVQEGVKPPISIGNITKKDVEYILSLISKNTPDIVDVVYALLDTTFPSLFNPEFSFRDGASTAHIGCYVGIFIRQGNKLDREGRDYWLKPLYEIGVIERVTFEAQSKIFVSGHIKAKSPNSAYKLNSNFIDLFSHKDEKIVKEYFSQDSVSQRLLFQTKAAKQAKKKFGSGDHCKLIQISKDMYAPHFLKNYEIVYTDDSDGDRVSAEEKQAMEKIGLKITIEDAWPDVILYSKESNSLWFIEAVTSDGEVDETKQNNLSMLCVKNNMNLGGATTTYLDWKSVSKRQQAHKNLAVGSFLWIAEDAGKHFQIRACPL